MKYDNSYNLKLPLKFSLPVSIQVLVIMCRAENNEKTHFCPPQFSEDLREGRFCHISLSPHRSFDSRWTDRELRKVVSMGRTKSLVRAMPRTVQSFVMSWEGWSRVDLKMCGGHIGVERDRKCFTQKPSKTW